MSKTVTLHFTASDGDAEDLRGGLKSFQSSLFYWLHKTGYGEVDWNELDKLEPTFRVSGVKSSKFKRVRD